MLSKSRVLIFSDAYGGLRYMLCLIELHINKGKHVTVVVIDHANYAKLLNYLNANYFDGALKILPIEGYKVEIKKGMMYYFCSPVLEAIFLRKSYRKYFSDITDGEVYLTARKYVYRAFYFSKRLSRNNKVYLLDADSTTNEVLSSPNMLTQWLRYLKLRLLYDWQIDFKREGEVIFGQIGAKYIYRYKVSVMDRDIYKRQTDTILSRYVVRGNALKVLLIDQNITESDMLDTRGFEAQMNSIGDVLKKNYPQSAIGIKRHPFFFSDNRFSEEIGVELENWIPAELYVSTEVRLIISFHTNVLKVPSHVCGISLIDMLPFRPVLRESYRKYLLNNSDNNILFPKTVEEFDLIVSDYADK